MCHDFKRAANRIGIAFVALLLLFGSGLAYELSEQHAISAINLHDDPNMDVFSEDEFRATQLVLENRENESLIYVDGFQCCIAHPVERLGKALSTRAQGQVIGI